MRYRKLRTLVINTHAGIGLRNGAIAEVRRRAKRFDIVLAQEVRDPDALRKALGEGWTVLPERQIATGDRRRATIFIAFRTSRFTVVQVWNPDITMGGEFSRRATTAALLDKRTGQLVNVATIHVQPLGQGLAGAPEGVVQRQTRQLETYTEILAACQGVRIAAGDFNQDLDLSVPVRLRRHTADVIFDSVGMSPTRKHRKATGPVRLMGAYVGGRGVKVISHRSFDLETEGMDHEVLVLTVKIRRQRRRWFTSEIVDQSPTTPTT